MTIFHFNCHGGDLKALWFNYESKCSLPKRKKSFSLSDND